MLKITRVSEAGSTRVIVSGRIGASQLPDLRQFLEAEDASSVVLDLTELSLVDEKVVQFLSVCEGQGIGLVGCPAYIRAWMVRERRSQWEDEMNQMLQAGAGGGVKNVVLVHGGFVDGSGWQGVYDVLKKDGYNVSIVQNPTISLADDVAVTKRTLAAQNGPTILVGHSYGGVVITEAGNDPNVAGLVYIAAFAPDRGESVSALIKNPPPGAPVPPIMPPQDGYLLLDRAKFRESFAADVAPDAATFMADSQVPWGLEALNGAVTEPAWRTKPSWYLVATDDKMIPPDAQRALSKRAGSTVVEARGSHAVYVSQPQAVAAIIMQAAQGVAVITQ
jgi:pimeloyl-ACP methyl ester carboxylesterase